MEMGRVIISAVIAAGLLAGGALPARALDGPYEPGLLRLAEVLGSLHFLRNLCGDDGSAWRGRMETMLATENPGPERRARFIASFNRGYRSFEANYATCTPSATEAIRRYMEEGEKLAREIALRYGN